MFTSDAARIIGITPKQLRVFLRSHSTGVGSGSRYEFSYDEVEQLRNAYWSAQPKAKKSEHDNEGTPGLPHEWLYDETKQPLFLAERRERLERMSARLREVGLDVPQMNDKVLQINSRAIAAALLNRRTEDE